MVGGNIVDFFSRKDKDDSDEILFLVKGAGSEHKDTCCITADVPKSAQGEISKGDSIWWQTPSVYLTVFGCGDTPFPKIGFSGGNARTFYEAKMKHGQKSLS